MSNGTQQVTRPGHYKGLTTQEWAEVRDKVSSELLTGIETDVLKSFVKWVAARTGEKMADGASMEVAVKQAVEEVMTGANYGREMS